MAAFQQFSESDIQSTSQHPLEFLVPFLLRFECYFLRHVRDLHREYQIWLQNARKWHATAMARSDGGLLAKWRDARATIEDFQRILDDLEEFLEEANNKSEKMVTVLTRLRKRLAEARFLEQLVRDTIQINVGNLSLQESRKSIHQADYLGRISLLGFVFIPMSLAMSFYGMNINEITGSGASWKTFLISTASLCLLVAAVCAFIWRKSRRVKFIVYPFFIPILLYIRPISFLLLLLINPRSLGRRKLNRREKLVKKINNFDRWISDAISEWWSCRDAFFSG